MQLSVPRFAVKERDDLASDRCLDLLRTPRITASDQQQIHAGSYISSCCIHGCLVACSSAAAGSAAAMQCRPLTGPANGLLGGLKRADRPVALSRQHRGPAGLGTVQAQAPGSSTAGREYAAIEQRQLGRTSLQVPTICFGRPKY